MKPSFLQTSGLSARGMPGPDVSFSHLLSRAVAKGMAAYLPVGRQPKRLSSFLQCVSEQVALVPGIDAPRPR
nr:hypothetical protein [uncultured Roseibium sp.]